MSEAIFTCNSCMIQFRSSDQQRYHMKTEWHRYNLKRRISQLPPISADIFAEKLQISERAKELNQVDEFGFPILKAKTPRYKRSDEVDLSKLQRRRNRKLREDNHERSVSPTPSVASQISKLSVNSNEVHTDFDEEKSYEYGFTTDSNNEYNSSDFESTSDELSGDEASSERPSITDCIFCKAQNKEVERNLKHMFASHGLYIPERSYLIDLTGLLNFLIDTIVVANECLCCSFKGSSLQSIRAHIASKGHSRLPYETKEERRRVAGFYDFSSEDEVQSNLTRNNGKSVAFEAEPDSGSEGTLPSDTDDINSNYTHAEVDNTGVELTLPSGSRAGHRSMRRIYRQNLPLPPMASDGNRTVAAGDRRFFGGVTDKTMKKNDKKSQQIERQIMNRDIRNQAKRGNFQTHYRDELLQ
ncbi:Cytoplasmic 60S subunit biogenesis factor REH1 [Lachancea thermotolerans]